MNEQQINDFLTKNAAITLSQTQLSMLETYFRMLVETNQKFNLTAICERQQVYEKHFIDSILGSVLLEKGAAVCDVGSGAGFPALPLKIARPDLNITAVDSLNKRVEFIIAVAAALGIEITAVHSRAEDFSGKNRQKFDTVCARAVAPLNILLEYCAPLVKIGGTVLAYKTDDNELFGCKNAISILGLCYTKSCKFTLPSGDNRCLLQFTKARETPLQYPRGQNKPRNNPL